MGSPAAIRHAEGAGELEPADTFWPSGYWKEKEDEFIAIRSEGGGQGSSSASSSSPCYEGVRRTLEFYEHNGTKTDWVMHEYNVLNDDMFVQVTLTSLHLHADRCIWLLLYIVTAASKRAIVITPSI